MEYLGWDWPQRARMVADCKKRKLRAAEEPHASSMQERNNKTAMDKEAPVRSSKERLNATLRQNEEALSPCVLRRTLSALQAIVDPSVSAVEGGKRGRGVANWYSMAPPEQRQDAGC